MKGPMRRPLIGMCGRLRICIRRSPSLLPRFRVGGARSRSLSLPLGDLRQLYPGAQTAPGIELREVLDDLGRLARLPAAQTMWEPETGASVFGRPQTQRNVLRMFVQVDSPSSTQSDSASHLGRPGFA